MRAVTTQLSQRVETLMELPAETRAAASEPRASAVVPKPAPAPAPPVAPAAPAVMAQPEMAELDLKLGELAELINNIEVRGQRGGRRFGPPPDGRVPGRPEGGPFVAPAPPGPPVASPGSPTVPGGSTSVAPVPPAPGGPPNGPRDGGERGGRRPPPEARGAGGPPPGHVDDPEDPKRIRIDLRLIRRELFEELVADREAFDALPLEEKQKVFALIEQRMAGVAQGIDVLKKELATRAVEVRTQDTAAAAAAAAATATSVAATPPAAPAPAPAPPPAPARTGRTARVPAAPVAPGPVAPPPAAKPPAHVTKRSTQMSGKRLAVKVERDGQLVGQVNADVDHAEAARDGVREDVTRARRGAIRRG